MTDLERMKGTFEPPEVDGENMVLSGVVPVATMQNYQREVVSYTKGRGRLSCVLQGYFPLPQRRWKWWKIPATRQNWIWQTRPDRYSAPTEPDLWCRV